MRKPNDQLAVFLIAVILLFAIMFGVFLGLNIAFDLMNYCSTFVK